MLRPVRERRTQKNAMEKRLWGKEQRLTQPVAGDKQHLNRVLRVSTTLKYAVSPPLAKIIITMANTYSAYIMLLRSSLCN